MSKLDTVRAKLAEEQAVADEATMERIVKGGLDDLANSEKRMAEAVKEHQKKIDDCQGYLANIEAALEGGSVALIEAYNAGTLQIVD